MSTKVPFAFVVSFPARPIRVELKDNNISVLNRIADFFNVHGLSLPVYPGVRTEQEFFCFLAANFSHLVESLKYNDLSGEDVDMADFIFEVNCLDKNIPIKLLDPRFSTLVGLRKYFDVSNTGGILSVPVASQLFTDRYKFPNGTPFAVLAPDATHPSDEERYPGQSIQNKVNFTPFNLFQSMSRTGMSFKDTLAMFTLKRKFPLQILYKVTINRNNFEITPEDLKDHCGVERSNFTHVITPDYVFYVDKDTDHIIAIGEISDDRLITFDNFYYFVN